MLANRVLQLGNRTKLPGTSKTPIWLCFMCLNLFLYAGIVVAMIEVDSCNFKYYYVAGALGFILILNVILMQVLIASRIGALTSMLQQDPQVIVGDPQCVEKLSAIPCYGLSEIDCLQVAIFQTYNAYAMDAKRHRTTEKVSHASDYSDVEWRSAESSDGEQPEALNEYLLSQNKKRSGSRLRRIFTRSSRASGREGSVYSCQSVDEVGSPPVAYSVNEGGLGRKNSAVPEGDGSRSLGTSPTAAVAITPRVKIGPPPAWDPLDDNNSSWDIIQKGIKDPGGSLLIQLLGQVKVGQPLSAVTLPVHILESRSLLERISDACVHWEFLLPLASGNITDKYQKLISVFKWFISAYRMKPIGARKPFNPVLGEVFHCVFPPMGCDGSATANGGSYVPPAAPATKAAKNKSSPQLSATARPPTGTSNSLRDGLEFIAEQVSHHPPVSALFARYKDQIELFGVYHPKSKLVSLNCAASIAAGNMILKINATNDRFHITWPSFFATGIVKGDPRLEIGGTVTITDMDTGIYAKVDFLRKGWLGGEFDKMECQIYSADKQPTEFKFEGTWFDVISESATKAVFHDPKVIAHLAPRPKVVETPNHPKQSRGLWKDLTIFVREGDEKGAGASKHKVENAQRAERKQMAADGKEFTPEFFRFVPPKNKSGKKSNASATAIDEPLNTATVLSPEEDAKEALDGALGFKAASDEDRYDAKNWKFVGHRVLVGDQ